MNPAQQLSKSQLRTLAEIPYTAPPGATPEGQKLINELRTLAEIPYTAPPGATPEGQKIINELRMTPVQPNKEYDTCIEKLIRGKDPDNRRLNRGNRNRLNNQELSLAIKAEHMGHGSSVLPRWWTLEP